MTLDQNPTGNQAPNDEEKEVMDIEEIEAQEEKEIRNLEKAFRAMYEVIGQRTPAQAYNDLGKEKFHEVAKTLAEMFEKLYVTVETLSSKESDEAQDLIRVNSSALKKPLSDDQIAELTEDMMRFNEQEKRVIKESKDYWQAVAKDKGEFDAKDGFLQKLFGKARDHHLDSKSPIQVLMQLIGEEKVAQGEVFHVMQSIHENHAPNVLDQPMDF